MLEVQKCKRAAGKFHQRTAHGWDICKTKDTAISDMAEVEKHSRCNKWNYIGKEWEVLLAAKLLDYEFIPLNDCDKILR